VNLKRAINHRAMQRRPEELEPSNLRHCCGGFAHGSNNPQMTR
jgi:hypothetical protein